MKILGSLSLSGLRSTGIFTVLIQARSTIRKQGEYTRQIIMIAKARASASVIRVLALTDAQTLESF